MKHLYRARGPLCLVLSLLILVQTGSLTASAADAGPGRL